MAAFSAHALDEVKTDTARHVAEGLRASHRLERLVEVFLWPLADTKVILLLGTSILTQQLSLIQGVWCFDEIPRVADTPSSAHCSRPATILALQFAASSNHIAVCHHLTRRHCTARRQFSSARMRSKKRPQADRRQRTRAYRPMPSGAKLCEVG